MMICIVASQAFRGDAGKSEQALLALRTPWTQPADLWFRSTEVCAWQERMLSACAYSHLHGSARSCFAFSIANLSA